jgi:glucokinase
MVAAPFVAADIGGTHARIGLVRAEGGGAPVTLLASRQYLCAAWPGLAAIIADFVEREVHAPVTDFALACAGYIIDGCVINDNLPWPVVLDELRDALHAEHVSLVNDFEALAYATQHIEPSASTLLTRAHEQVAGPRLVLGPGTGLGSAVLIPHRPQPIVLPAEAGQIGLAPGNALERDVLAVLARGGGYVPYERAVSGPGLVNLYQAVCTLRGIAPVLADPTAITAAALRNDDAAARQTAELFCGLLGSLTGDLAMLYGAAGGVWLAGGILPHLREFLQHSSFVERFLDKGSMRAFLERVPVRLLQHGQLGVIGAASWYLGREDAP